MRKAKSAKAAKRRRKKRARPARAGATETALAMLAHEIRTPLNGILALSELIAAADLPEREREWAAQVKGAAEHLAALATLVVDGVRAEKRGLVLRAEPFRPRALAEARRRGACGARRGEGARRRCRRSRTTCRSSSIGDRVRLRAALENLADNAVKFTEPGASACRSNAARRRARAPSAQLRVHRQRHRAVAGGDRAAVPAVQAGERGHRAPLSAAPGWGSCSCGGSRKAMGGDLTVKSRAGQGSTFPSHRHARRGAGRSAERWRARGRTRAARREACACCARRTIRMPASCSTRS